MGQAHDWRHELARARRIAENLNDPIAIGTLDGYIRELEAKLQREADAEVLL